MPGLVATMRALNSTPDQRRPAAAGAAM